jgi:hypothetical protein
LYCAIPIFGQNETLTKRNNNKNTAAKSNRQTTQVKINHHVVISKPLSPEEVILHP